MMRNDVKVVLCCSAGWMSFASAAFAQVQGPAPVAQSVAGAITDSESQEGVADIVVTALKRSENVQNVPAAVSVLNSDRVEALGVSNLNQIGNLAPGISVVPVRTQAFVFIRGVGQTLTTPNADAAVATNLNGVYLPAEIAGTAFFDVDRIELLPGPQGTLYGRNSTGGVINLASRMPKDRLGVDGFVEYGNYDRIQAVVGVDVPLTSTLRSRTAGSFVRHDGYFNNGEDDQRTTAIRETLIWQPSERTTVTGVATYTHDGGIGNVFQNVPPLECGNRCATFDPKALGYFNRADTFQGSLQINQEVSAGLSLTYIGGYSHLKLKVKNSIWTGPPLAPLKLDETIGIQTHEVRLDAELGRFHGIAGLYYFDQTTFYRNDVRPNPNQHRVNPFDADSHGTAVFGQGTYEVIDGVRATAGLRYSNTFKKIDGVNNLYNAAEVPVTIRPYQGSSSLNRVDWKVGIEADMAAGSMLYANASSGFTPGGFSTAPAVIGQVAASPFKPVKLVAYTGGLKNRFAQGKVTINLEGFYYDYKNYQVSARDIITGENIVFNADKATVYGAQTDIRLKPSRHDEILLGATYLHAEADRLRTPAGNFDGFDLPYSPKWSINAYYQRTFDVGQDAQIRADVNFKYTSKRWSLYTHARGFDIKANTHTDVTLGYFAADDRWSIQAFVRNLEDSLVKTTCGNVAPGPSGCFFEAPRTYGARVGFKF